MAGNNPIRIYLDNNVYDMILAESLEFVISMAAKARFYSCHITEDELMAMPPEKAAKQRALMAILQQLTEEVPSIPAVYGHGKYGRTRFGDERANAIYESLRPKHHPPDAIHVATANSDGCEFFVTEDAELRSDIDRLNLGMKPLDFQAMQALLRGYR